MKKQTRGGAKKRAIRAANIDETLLDGLRNPSEAVAYLQAASEVEGPDRIPLLLRALRDIFKARGVAKVTGESETKRRNFYRIFSETGNPSIKTMDEALSKVGLKLTVVQMESSRDTARR